MLAKDRGDPLEVGAGSVGDPPAVAALDLAASPRADGPGVLPGGHRLGDNVPLFDHPEAVAGEDCRPIGDQLSAQRGRGRP